MSGEIIVVSDDRPNIVYWTVNYYAGGNFS